MGRKRRRLTDAAREERRRQDRERLEAALAELLTSEGWKRWLRARSVLHTYSLHNTLLIAHQCAARGIEPTYVAGFKAWLRLGRCVKKGERGIAVWAPMRLKAREEEGEDGDEPKLRFRVTYVFDVSQTAVLPDREPAPLSPPCGEVAGDSHVQLLPALEQLAVDHGYSVAWVEGLAGGAKGLCRRSERRLEVLDELSANARVQVLVHELCHMLAGEPEELARLGYRLEEIVVESATYIACSAAGLATDADSIPYVAGWAGEEDPQQVVRQAAAAIDTLARAIEEAIAGGENEDREQKRAA